MMYFHGCKCTKGYQVIYETLRKLVYIRGSNSTASLGSLFAQLVISPTLPSGSFQGGAAWVNMLIVDFTLYSILLIAYMTIDNN